MNQRSSSAFKILLSKSPLSLTVGSTSNLKGMCKAKQQEREKPPVDFISGDSEMDRQHVIQVTRNLKECGKGRLVETIR